MFNLEGNSEWSLKGPEPNALDCEARSLLGTQCLQGSIGSQWAMIVDAKIP